MKKCKLFLNKNEKNEATSYYIDIIGNVLENNFDKYEHIDSLKEINKEDVVFVVTLRSYFQVLKNNFFQKVIFWFQGVEPEELSYVLDKKTLRDKLRIIIFTILEFLVLRKAIFIFFVSKAMMEHYKKKYKYNKDNYFIMPCFNKNINKEFFSSEKYCSPSFVYAGGILKWQCVDNMMILFKQIQDIFPNSSLTILTKDIKSASNLVNRYSVSNVDIKHVPLDLLDEEIRKYKYGFLIREDIKLNNVATPTKFNSYLACGVIPIISNVIFDYKGYIENMKYIVIMKDEKDYSSAVKKIEELEHLKINRINVFKEYYTIFDEYYNINIYRNKLEKKIIDIFNKVLL